MYVLRAFVVFAIISGAIAWHVCHDEPFCQKLRNRSNSQFEIQKDSIVIDKKRGKLSAKLIQTTTDREFQLAINVHQGDVFRITIRDVLAAQKPIPSALLDDILERKIEAEVQKSQVVLTGTNQEIAIDTENFSIRSVNIHTGEVILVNGVRDMYVEDALALKVTFENMQNAYGIPEHGERLKLKDTKNEEPYRHFNVDYPYYQVESRESLYGTIPVLYAHGLRPEGRAHVAGVFWHNPAQTFVDLDHSNNMVTVDFISEAGTLDVFILPGGEFKTAVNNYVQLTGTAPLPPLFALGYHQSRYSYISQEDVLRVATGMQNGEFPVDVVWLDIHYTNGKRYFTWNYTAFPDPMGMQDEIEKMSMRLVTIIDPHIKAEDGYFVYDEMKTNGYYVMNPDQSMYIGNCWPGASTWVDFFNPKALEWWSELYSYDSYPNTTSIVHIWNDMNEPAVFEAEENTMPRDALHYGGIEHKEVHNMFGYMQSKGTYEGLVARDYIQQRPFVLTRSHFAGTQRYAAIWTGDNAATWEHLRVSIPICLSEALAGLSFCGADVGGFIQRPSDELFQRWYQLGAWYPFFRAHSNDAQDYREPFLYPDDVQVRIRTALRQRYAHLPYWYAQWYEHERYGKPVLRPLVYNYPEDENVAAIDTQFMIGDNVLVAPVLHEGADQLQVYLPAKDKWYYLQGSNNYQTVSSHYQLAVDMDTMPVFYRAGSIIPRKDTVRASTDKMKNDPYSLYIFTNCGVANGTLYDDDNVSYDYRNQIYNYLSLEFKGDSLKSELIDRTASYSGKFVLGSVYIFNDKPLTHLYTSVVLTNDGNPINYPVTYHGDVLQMDFNVEINEKTFAFTLI